ncbi:DEAD/DEAH box helicase [Caldicellulosiruptor acetigenus]|uniref:DEAD/DEAH box helicase n=1 Tax=Caldicellulosiruptor acetigenus TaxID=301953 RepID=UPI00040B76EF|nr:DEAD/DEAH box helicase [Caldicellulosiruptor acetigenus]WAM37007.1 DEAD/DEAH box helicase [Caldicellulosiruptor acetigenus]
MNEIAHWIISELPEDIRRKADEIINKRKIENKLFTKSTLVHEEKELLEKVLEIYELAIIDLWDKEEKKNEFSFLNKKCFDIIQVFPLPQDDIPKIKHVLKLIGYSYLGEKWEDGKRFLIEEKNAWSVSIDDKTTWDERLFKKTYLAILYLVKKNSWEDLRNAIDLINSLRDEQKDYEERYLESIDIEFKKGAALELASFYHFAKSIEILGEFMLEGEPSSDKVISELEYHLNKGVYFCDFSGNFEFSLILRLMLAMFKKMVFNSIWRVSEKINSKITSFVKTITKASKPVYELLYPQRAAILEMGLLDPASRGIVVNLPTSSGKTLIAEFKILQALNQFENGWVAYAVPTRALVNQITNRLIKDLGHEPLNLKVEKMSGALEVDFFEEKLIEEKAFDILITTYEKLNLLIRQGIEERLGRKLVLLIVDEAHNIESPDRGLNIEMLISIVKSDCKYANFLLLTPFIPNSREVSKWISPDNPKSIEVQLQWWKPNDQIVGVYYAEGEKRKWKTYFEPLITTHSTIFFSDKVQIGSYNDLFNVSRSKLNNKSLLTSIVAKQLEDVGSLLIVARTINETWEIADHLYSYFDNVEDEDILLVQRFVAAELGENFPLVKYLSKGIGIHHAGLPDEVRYLMEWLMEENKLRVLVATTTIAQGINFPVSAVLMASYSYPFGEMPVRDFWNIVGRAGRIDQKSLGIVGIAVKNENDKRKIMDYVRKQTGDLISILVKMVDELENLGQELGMELIIRYPEWSAFLQYISHLYKQYNNVSELITRLEMELNRTYGYIILNQRKKEVLKNAVKQYVDKLSGKEYLVNLADQTGFSPDSIERAIYKIRELKLKQSDWYSSKMFNNETGILKKLIGVMLSVPEVKKSLEIDIPGETKTYSKLSHLIIDWVSGKEFTEIAKNIWGSDDPRKISDCVKAIYQKVVNGATWGLAAFLSMPTSGINFSQLTEDEIRNLKNIPAMVYYGVNTEEGIVMRINNVPRSIANKLGEIYKMKNEDISPRSAYEWLKNISISIWDESVPSNKSISGADYKRIWEKLSGER